MILSPAGRRLLLLPCILIACLLGMPAGHAADAPKPAASDRAALVGTWKIISFKDDAVERIDRLGGLPPGDPKADPAKFPRIVFTADECWVLHVDGKRDVL